jgi:hypothetical protein
MLKDLVLGVVFSTVIAVLTTVYLSYWINH